MPGAGVSGAFGDFKVGASQVETKKWSFNPKCSTPQYASNKTGGYKRTVAGIKSGNGNSEFPWDPGTPQVTVMAEGTALTVNCYLTAAAFYAIPAVVGDFKVDVDIDSGEIVTGSVSWVANGAWTQPGSGLILPDGIQLLPEIPADPPLPSPEEQAAMPSQAERIIRAILTRMERALRGMRAHELRAMRIDGEKSLWMDVPSYREADSILLGAVA